MTIEKKSPNGVTTLPPITFNLDLTLHNSKEQYKELMEFVQSEADAGLNITAVNVNIKG